jgi:hypothetical protein
MHETAAEQKESRSPEAPADIVILFILMKISSAIPAIMTIQPLRILSMAKQDNYKKERTETTLSFHFSDFGMRGYISIVKPSGLFLRFSFSFW